MGVVCRDWATPPHLSLANILPRGYLRCSHLDGVAGIHANPATVSRINLAADVSVKCDLLTVDSPPTLVIITTAV